MSRPKKIYKTVFLTEVGAAGETKVINFKNGSRTYMSRPLAESFRQMLVDNVGFGEVKFTYNHMFYKISEVNIDGAKTLKSGDVMTVVDDGGIDFIQIHFIMDSTIEIALYLD